MRLQLFERASGMHWFQRMACGLMNAIAGNYPGPIMALSYRRDAFGKHFAVALQEALRGSTEWSRAECEVIAFFSSKQLSCTF